MAGKGKFGAIKGIWSNIVSHLSDKNKSEQELVVVTEDLDADEIKQRVSRVGKLGSPPCFSGNSKQRRKKRRAWMRNSK